MSNLKDLTLEELWGLFPIELSPHNPLWQEWAQDEISTLSVMLSDYNPILNHIGSTAIPEIQAKPIIDILIEISPHSDKTAIKSLMESNGYICMSKSTDRISFNKGYTPSGYADKVFHIHFHHVGDNDEIYFKNYLIEYPDIAQKYDALKQSLLPKYRHNRDGYTDAKTSFIKMITDIAKGSPDLTIL